MNALVYVDMSHRQGARAFIRGKIKLHKMKNEKKLPGFSYDKIMANFEVFL